MLAAAVEGRGGGQGGWGLVGGGATPVNRDTEESGIHAYFNVATDVSVSYLIRAMCLVVLSSDQNN